MDYKNSYASITFFKIPKSNLMKHTCFGFFNSNYINFNIGNYVLSCESAEARFHATKNITKN